VRRHQIEASSNQEPADVRVFLRLSKNISPPALTLSISGGNIHSIATGTQSGASCEGLRDPPLFSSTASPCRITTGPDSKAAMNRPQRFRGLATDPGVQRKTPRTVIQRENKPKGPWLEEQLEIGQ
jgi:hypothetical protein